MAEVVHAISIMMALSGHVAIQVVAMVSTNFLIMLEPILGALIMIIVAVVICGDAALGAAVALILSISIWLFTENVLGNV